MLKKTRCLTRPTPARQDAPFLRQGRSSSADPRFTFHTSRFTAPGSVASTRLVDFFSILLDLMARSNMRNGDPNMGMFFLKAAASERACFSSPWTRKILLGILGRIPNHNSDEAPLHGALERARNPVTVGMLAFQPCGDCR